MCYESYDQSVPYIVSFIVSLSVPLDILSSADLSYFNLGMFNFVQVMWNYTRIIYNINFTIHSMCYESYV